MSRRIVVLPGDGIGPEVTDCAVRVLRLVGEQHGLGLEFQEAQLGGVAIEQQGDPLPEMTLEACLDAEAVLLGAVGDPRWSDPALPVRPEQGLLRLRQAMGLYANLRPVRVWPALQHLAPLRSELLQGVDLLIVRELAGGIYYGPRQEAVDPHPDRAEDTMPYSRPEVARVARVAFAAAAGRRGRLCSVDKANVLASSRLWRRVVEEISAGYPQVSLEHQLVDAMAMHLVRRPADFDVLLAGNLFGDILSDEASVLAGSLGLLPSASLGDGGPGLFEPVHGSAPDIKGQGQANPIAAILSGAMLLRHGLRCEEAALAVEGAVAGALSEGPLTADLASRGQPSCGSHELTERVLGRLRQSVRVPSSV